MNCYLDSSIILRRVLGHPQQFADFGSVRFALSSKLILVECHRTIERYRLDRLISDDQVVLAKEELRDFINEVNLAKISDAVLQRAAASYPTVIGSLDAIHLSTALIWKEENEKELVMLTHDEQLARASRAVGFEVLGV